MVAGSLEARTWDVLNGVFDPEIPVISLVDLGIIRHVRESGESVEVGVSPTYSGCPATEVIRQDIRTALKGAGIHEFSLVDVLSPPWSSAWISEKGSNALRAYGIAPPQPADNLPVACPRCKSMRTERTSEFGSTPCKALHRCTDCLEPFERFKCI